MNGLSMQTLLVDAAAALVGFAANWLLQSTMLIAAGLSIGWILRCRGSAVQSAVYLVVTPGAPQYDNAAMQRGELAADADFMQNVDRSNHASTVSDPQGGITFPALIPGATYRILSYRDGRFHAAKDFQAQASETLDLGDLVVERPQ